MAKKKELSALTDPDNDPQWVEVTPSEEEGLSVEDAYRHLAHMKPEPVSVEEEL